MFSPIVTLAGGRGARYDTLVQRMLQVWDGLLGTAVLAWIGLRVAHAAAEWSWREQVRATAMEEEQDEWADTRRSSWEERWQQARLQKEGYREVAKPLEPYVLVFIVFAVPAIVMSTTECVNHSGIENLQNGGRYGGAQHPMLVNKRGWLQRCDSFAQSFVIIGTLSNLCD